MFICHLYVFFGEMSGSFAHFLIGLFIFLVLSCMSCLYILEINSLSIVSFALIFSHSEGCLFTLLLISFIVQKLLSLIRSHFVFISITLGSRHRGSCCDLCHRVFCLCFPLRVLEFLVLHFGKGNATPLQYSCLENSMGGGAWWAAVHGVTKSRTRLSDFTFTFHFHALEKEMATHSSVLAWRIPGTEEPGRRPFMGPHRVGHD